MLYHTDFIFSGSLSFATTGYTATLYLAECNSDTETHSSWSGKLPSIMGNASKIYSDIQVFNNIF